MTYSVFGATTTIAAADAAAAQWDTSTNLSLSKLSAAGTDIRVVEGTLPTNVTAQTNPVSTSANCSNSVCVEANNPLLYCTITVDTAKQDWILASATGKKAILTHEIGHCFGLGHTNDGTSVMWTPAGGGFGLPTDIPNVGDIQRVNSRYF